MKSPNWLGNVFNPLKKKILNDPYYRFQSAEEIATAARLGIKINVSQAGIDDWLRLPGISIHQARRLVELVGMGVEILSIEDLAAALCVPVSRLGAIAPILEFAYYNPESLLAPPKINPNTASLEQFASIAFFTPDLVDRIVREREQAPFRDLIDLKNRLSLDSQTLSHLMHFLQF
ncbi:ComEA family DNA-binding protein [Pannus brasiliensis CCIBt3594]|uniref:ComEA family DNA-binding protein n=1 Tax=Pannus brasiliensis CCIBt3594 TaxID=1427578 RepID=A0AAW9QZZ4_9CHRO